MMLLVDGLVEAGVVKEPEKRVTALLIFLSQPSPDNEKPKAGRNTLTCTELALSCAFRPNLTLRLLSGGFCSTSLLLAVRVG